MTRMSPSRIRPAYSANGAASNSVRRGPFARPSCAPMLGRRLQTAAASRLPSQHVSPPRKRRAYDRRCCQSPAPLTRPLPAKRRGEEAAGALIATRKLGIGMASSPFGGEAAALGAPSPRLFAGRGEVRGLGDWPRRRSAEGWMCETDSRERESRTGATDRRNAKGLLSCAAFKCLRAHVGARRPHGWIPAFRGDDTCWLGR
jgi:hypothetical protein